MLREIYQAKKNIEGWAIRTPLIESKYLGDLTGGRVWMKLENQQVTGSFKIRGAVNKILSLSDEEKGRGVVTASSGNHAQGLGYAAQKLGIDATIIVPENTPQVKIEAISSYGVDLRVEGGEYMDSELLAKKMEREEGKVFVSPYNDPELIAGQGTIGLEMLEDEPGLDVVIVPVGGGGLISGIGTIWKNASEAKIIGVQSKASPVMCESIKAGRILDMHLEESYAEGLHGGIEKGSVTFDICKSLVDEFILVEEESILDAISCLLHKHHMVVEGAGAIGVSALLENPGRFKDENIGVVISGGNLDEELLEIAACKS